MQGHTAHIQGGHQRITQIMLKPVKVARFCVKFDWKI